MIHLDLFSGIGGFAYAADRVWPDVTHIFCDNDKFCQQVLKKHWPESEVYDDIRTITADTLGFGRIHGQTEKQPAERHEQAQREPQPGVEPPFLLTGGFPCQPFSNAGLRRGTADERHLWPEMLRVIRLSQPRWVIAENVRGLLVWNDGLVFEQVCADLEAAGYVVQPFIIPAVALDAPHRRDRVWFVAHADSERTGRRGDGDTRGNGRPSHAARPDSNADHAQRKGLERHAETDQGAQGRQEPERPAAASDWDADWSEVAANLCRMDDGLPVGLDGFELTKSKHRRERIKALGNAIVPQVAIEIMKAIKSAEAEKGTL